MVGRYAWGRGQSWARWLLRGLACAALWTTSAHAAQIRWSGDGSCRRELEVVEQIESMIKRPLNSVEVADFQLELNPPAGETISLTLTTETRGARVRSARLIRGRDCAEITDAAAVAIALAIGAPAEPAKPSNPEQIPENVDPGQSAAQERAPVPTPASSRSWLLGLGGLLDSSVTPHVVVGGELRVGLRGVGFRAELTGGLSALSEVRDSAGRGGAFQLLYAAPLVCATTLVLATSGLMCLGYELGQLNAEGLGVKRGYSRSTFWQAVRLELGVAVPVSARLAIATRVGGVVALTRHSFVLDQPQAVHRPALFSARAYLGLELTLGR